MHRESFGRRDVLHFRQFVRKGYALFHCLGREVVICSLSVATLTYATTCGACVRTEVDGDSIGRPRVNLSEVVVTGARAPLTEAQAAKMVSVITRDDICRSAAETVNDVLKMAAGVDVRQRGGFGVQTDISINGGTFDQITILLNGTDISSPQTGHNAADFPVALSDIERIEVLEGAAARVYGSSAFSGAVNIVTRTEAENNVTFAAEGGSFGTFGGTISAAMNTKSVHNQMSTSYTRSDGGTIHSDFIKRKAFYQGRFSSPFVDARWQAGVTSQDFGANTFYSTKYDDQYEATRRYIVSASADIRTSRDGGIVVTPSVYWHRDYDHYQLTKGLTGAANGENYHCTDVGGASLNAYARWSLGTTAVGFDMRREHILSTVYGSQLAANEYKPIGGTTRVYDHEASRTNTGIFFEHNATCGPLSVSAGLLANKNTGIDGCFRFYPGIDIALRPDDNWKIYASWNKALRVPSFTDLYTNNAVQQGDPNLKPERVSTFKAGARWSMKGITAAVDGFYSDGTNIIDWVYIAAESTKYQALNIGHLDNMGASTELSLRIDELLSRPIVTRIRLAYAFIHQKHDTEKEIFGSLYALEYLRHKAVLQLDHRIAGRLSARWDVRWQERMNGYSPYAKIDLKLLWSGDDYSLHLTVDNLTAHRYYDLGGIRQPGLWIMVGGSFMVGF